MRVFSDSVPMVLLFNHAGHKDMLYSCARCVCIDPASSYSMDMSDTQPPAPPPHQRALSLKRAFDSEHGPGKTNGGASDAVARRSENNVLGIANSPPYTLLLSPGLTLEDTIRRGDFETISKLAETVLFNYKYEHTTSMQLSYDIVDRTYQFNVTLPFDAVIDLSLLTALYKVRAMLVTKKPWAELAQVPDPVAGEIRMVQNVAIGIASYQRPKVVIEDVVLMPYESEAHYCTPDDFQSHDVRRAEFVPTTGTKRAPVKPVSSAAFSSSASIQGTSNSNAMQVDEKTDGASSTAPTSPDMGLPPATGENPLQIPMHSVPYRIVVPHKMTFADVVDVPDRDMLRKMAQVVFYFYKTSRTISICVSYDAGDRAYEVTFSCPRDIHIDLDFVGSVYAICPMLVTRQPWIRAARAPSATTGDMQVTQNFSLRFASHRRQYLTLTDTSLLIWRTKTTYVPAEDEADLVRPTKRAPTLQWGGGGIKS